MRITKYKRWQMEKIRQEIAFLCTGLLCETRIGAAGNGSEEMLEYIFGELKGKGIAAEVYRELLCHGDLKVRFEAARRSIMLGANMQEAKKELLLMAKFSPNAVLRYNAQQALSAGEAKQ